MPIKWKPRTRFKPEVILRKIEAARTVNPRGGASFKGFELEEHLPALQSMLEFPSAAGGMDKHSLVWKSLSRAGSSLTPESFLAAINEALSAQLSVQESQYHLLTSLSLNPSGLPRKTSVLGCSVELYEKPHARKYGDRDRIIKEKKVKVESTPAGYCNVMVKVTAKSPTSAYNKSMDALDLMRALLCLMGNPRMTFYFLGSQAHDPINVVRLGSRHTVHFPNGQSVADALWYEPGFVPAKPYLFKQSDVVVGNLRWALRHILQSSYRDKLVSSLLRFVRALDHSDPNTAYLRLWGALEELTTPGAADYEKLVRRCAFLFREHDYHLQVLEHLREYRNSNVHAGEESQAAKTHCFQLQMYYVNAAWFYIRNGKRFANLDEANQFLDLPPDVPKLRSRLKLIKGAIKFMTPRAAEE